MPSKIKITAHSGSMLLAGALLAIAYFHFRILDGLPHALQPDAQKVYLPGAMKLLEEGIGFFAEPDSYRTAPVNFLWPALFSADAEAVIAANLWLSVLTLSLIFFTALRLSGAIAAIAAGLLYAFSPLLAPLFTTVLSEPQFIVGTALWILGTVLFVQRGKGWLCAAVAGGIISLLSRPIWLPFLLLSLPILACQWLLDRNQLAWRKLLLVHTLILIPVGAYCFHNQIQFGFFGISTGGGVALYLGNHPLTWGIEPEFLMLNYDVPSTLIPWGGDHLTLESDRVLRTIGWSMIWDRSFGGQVQWLVYKVGAILFFTKNDFAPDLYSVRALRVVELVLAIYGLGFIRLAALRWWFLGAVVLQVAQLSMVLYNKRYSVGSLEIWLIILAACGIARLLHGLEAKTRRVRSGFSFTLTFSKPLESLAPRLAVLLAVAVGTGVAHWHRRLTDPLQPNIDRAPVRTLFELKAPRVNESLSKNVVALPNGAYYVSRDEGLFALDIPDPPHHELGFNQILSLTLTIVPPAGKSCRGGRISFEPFDPMSAIPFTALPIEFKGDGEERRYAISATHPFSALYVASEGVLRFRPFCPKNTQVAIHGVALLESTAHRFYLSRVQLP